ncbi:MAG: nitrite reductase large subunit NirB [Burkholderiaceae bacterium]
MKEKLVIVGNGMAPGKMIDHLLELCPDKYDITIFNAEPRVNYNRIMLSPVLSGEKSYEDIITHDDAFYAKHNITLHKSQPISEIKRDEQSVVSIHGVTAHYDKLVIATGSQPFIIPVPGKELDGVLTYRDLDDVQAMLSACETCRKAVVIGGGLLGLEAAAGLHAQGMHTTVIHLMPSLMERQLDTAAGYLLEREIKRRGIEVRTNANTKAIVGSDKVQGVLLDDGTELEADIVVMAVGIKPETRLAAAAQLDTGRGIIVNDSMQTSDPAIYALGECAEHRGSCYGLVAPLFEMAQTAAQHLANAQTTHLYTGSVTSTRLKVTGIDLFSAGDFEEQDGREEIVLRDASAGVYKRLILSENKIVGAVLYGDTNDGPWYFDLLRQQEDITERRDTLIFGQAYQGGANLDPTAAVAALPDDAQICGCNGISKKVILNAIETDGLSSVDDVRAHTKASASCGTCTGLVEQLLTMSLGDAFSPKTVTTLCACTDLSHDDVRRLIVMHALKSIPAVMQALEWKTSCGCAKCRPALNYYLVCEWPAEYADDYQSRFINERAHANIQKDGTYSIVPRMWGGMTSSKELRAIADVVDKFDIPAVKVTGGQRIDMLGIHKEDLPAVWADLGKAGFVSGHAYAKGLRTVKTCVGTDWCRFGTQDSTGLGIRIERAMWGSWTPAKVKMAVSGCPRNCAEATCKDVGIICVEAGYELHFAGAAGLDIKGTEVLGMIKTEEAVLEHVAALVQMYREQGHYLERIYKWARRVGIDEIRERIMTDTKTRLAYAERFARSQTVAQVDPWADRVKGQHAHEFQPIQIKRENQAMEVTE